MRRATNNQSGLALLSMIGLLALLLVPADCSTAPGPAMLSPAPDRPTAFAPAADGEQPATLAAAAFAATADHAAPRLDPAALSEDTVRSLRLLLDCAGSAGAGALDLGTSVLPSAASSNPEPVVPGVLDSAGLLVLALPAVARAWRAPALPRGRPLTGPEPPPP